MMKNKLISLNFGLTLTLEDADGQEHTEQFSGVLPSRAFQRPSQVLHAMREFIFEHLGERPKVLPERRIKALPVDTERIVQELVS